MQQHFGRQSFYYPVMLESIKGSESVFGIPVKTLLNEVNETTAGVLKDLWDGLGVWDSHLASGVGNHNGLIVHLVKEYLPSG